MNAEFHYEPEILTLGRIGADGRHGTPRRADYVLYHNKKKLAVIEAKKAGDDVTKGEVQARFYPEALGHMVPAADMSWSLEAMSETFLGNVAKLGMRDR